MTIDISTPTTTSEDVLKLRIVHALAGVALKTGQTFAQFTDALAVAGVMPDAKSAGDCTDLEQDAIKLGVVMQSITTSEPVLQELLASLKRIERVLVRAS